MNTWTTMRDSRASVLGSTPPTPEKTGTSGLPSSKGLAQLWGPGTELPEGSRANRCVIRPDVLIAVLIKNALSFYLCTLKSKKHLLFKSTRLTFPPTCMTLSSFNLGSSGMYDGELSYKRF